MERRYIAMNGIIAALLVVLNALNPIGFGMFQFRIGQALAALMFYDEKYLGGILLGVGLANMFSPIGFIDVAAGVAIGILAFIVSRFIKNKWLNCVQYSLIAGLIVGWMLNYSLGAPFLPSFISVFGSMLVVMFMGVAFFNKYLPVIEKGIRRAR